MISQAKKSEEKFLLKLRELPEEKRAEVMDFIDFLRALRKKRTRKVMFKKDKDSAINALLEVDKIAIETGISDFAYQHDHYLYGTSKK